MRSGVRRPSLARKRSTCCASGVVAREPGAEAPPREHARPEPERGHVGPGRRKRVPYTLGVAEAVGRETATPGTNQIDVECTLTFSRPVGQGDVESVSLRANGVDVSSAVGTAGSWAFLDDSTLRLRVPLRALTAAAVPFGPDELTVRFESTLTVRGHRPARAATAYDFTSHETEGD